MVVSAEVDGLNVDEAEFSQVVELGDEVVVEGVVDDEAFGEGDICVANPLTG